MKDALITIGTYERLLYGLNLTQKSLKESFVYPSHISTITCLASNSQFLCSGSTDETIKLYNLVIKKEIGSLMHHQGTITSLQLFKNQHLISAAADGLISIVRLSDFELLKSLKGHQGSVLDTSLHKSGKVLLSLGIDQTLKCWDLTKGLMSFSMKMKSKSLRKVFFSSSCEFFAVFSDLEVILHSIESGFIKSKIESKSRINCGVFVLLDDVEYLILGGEDRVIKVYNLNGDLVKEWVSKHTLRIKDMAALEDCLVTCSSDGSVHVWDLSLIFSETNQVESKQPQNEKFSTLDSIDKFQDGSMEFPIVYETKCRLTCINICSLPKNKQKAVMVEKDFEESDFEPIVPKKDKITVKFDDASDRVAVDKKKKKKAGTDKPKLQKVKTAKVAKKSI